jgi:hypothetical protein
MKRLREPLIFAKRMIYRRYMSVINEASGQFATC